MSLLLRPSKIWLLVFTLGALIIIIVLMDSGMDVGAILADWY
jgi:hypothetical protein